MKRSYESYKKLFQEIADIKYAAAVLQWDQETYLPPKGNDIRGRQLSTLSEMAHRMFTDEKTGELLQSLLHEPTLNDRKRKNIELSYVDFKKNKKLPVSFVRKMSETVNKSFHAWVNARKENNFSHFQQPLQEVISLKRQEAEYIGFEAHPYDALMNDYDKGLTVEFTDKLFKELIPQLSNILSKIKSQPEINNEFLLLLSEIKN